MLLSYLSRMLKFVFLCEIYTNIRIFILRTKLKHKQTYLAELQFLIHWKFLLGHVGWWCFKNNIVVNIGVGVEFSCDNLLKLCSSLLGN